MEESKPNHSLADILAQMQSVPDMNLTVSARTGNGAVFRFTSSFSGRVNISLFHSRRCDVASQWNDQPCHLCGAGMLHDGVRLIAPSYRGKIFKSESRGAFCDHCADGFVEFDSNEESVWLAFRDQVDGAEVADLARIRKKLKLSQLEAAPLAGGGENAFSRYERGQAKPVAAVINLFRLLDGHPELRRKLR